MSLGISVKGKIKSFVGPTNAPIETAKKVAEDIKRAIDQDRQWSCRVYDLGQSACVLTAEIHPGIESVQIHALGDGSLMFRARTTPVGPGYHLTAVDLFDDVTNQFGIEWDDLDKADATGYLQHRRQDVLEEAFIRWLKDFAHFIVTHPMEGCVSMDLPHGIRVEAADYVATTLGPRNDQWLHDIIVSPKDRVLDFYPWWNKQKDALFYQGMALTLGWNLVPWREPRSPSEENVMKMFVNACQKAVDKQTDIELPRKAWTDCCRWLNQDIPQEAKNDDPIGELGYRHGLIHFPIGANWSVRLPGRFTQEKPPEVGAWMAWDQNQRVQVRIMPIKNEEKDIKEILTRYNDPSLGQRITMENKEIGFYGVGDLGRSEDGDSVLQAEYICGNSVLILQVIGGPQDSEWAVDVWESIKRAV